MVNPFLHDDKGHAIDQAPFFIQTTAKQRQCLLVEFLTCISRIEEELTAHPISLRRKDNHQGEKTNPQDLAGATNAPLEETI